MARAPKPRDAFEVKLSKVEQEELVDRLATEIQAALDARVDIIGENQLLDSYHKLYEGGDRKITKNTPWPGAANLTSWIGTEKVDAVRSRVVQTIFAEPMYTVEGWGESAARAPFVEAFHQWKVEDERLQSKLSKVVHNALIEGTGVLEVAEKPMLRKVRERIVARIQTRPDGVPIAAPDGTPIPMTDPEGNPIPAGPDEQGVPMVVDRTGKVRGGPQYRVISLKDYVHMPGHAQDKADIWAYAKRVWKRVGELKTLEKLNVYKNVDELGTDGEREVNAADKRESITIADQKGATAEKELWEILFLNDLDGDGIEEWYVATLHIGKKVLLRLQKDDLGQARYLLFTPYPRPTYVYGYSLMQKLETIIEEHTAWRNMISDRSHLVINAPLKRVFGSIWNPKTEPWGPGRVMTVRDIRDVEPMQINDVPSSAIQREGTVLAASERVSGLVDQNSGVTPMEDRTLGEVRYVGAQSLVRIDEIVKHLQEALEELFLIRHEIWKRTLRDQSEPFPQGLQASLESAGMVLPSQQIDATMLEGTFRGKPHGSVETADRTQQKNDLVGFLTAIVQYANASPALGATLGDPDVAKAILIQAMRVYRWENKVAVEKALDTAIARLRTQPPMPPEAPQPQGRR